MSCLDDEFVDKIARGGRDLAFCVLASYPLRRPLGLRAGFFVLYFSHMLYDSKNGEVHFNQMCKVSLLSCRYTLSTTSNIG